MLSDIESIIFLSDVHISSSNPVCRKDDLTKVQWDKLNYVYELAEGCRGFVVVAGDFVDTACSWTVMPQLAAFFRRWSSKVRTGIVFGQHDTYMYDAEGRKKTIIGTLIESGFVELLSDKPVRINVGPDNWAIYGASYGQGVPVPEDNTDRNILAIHAPITDQSLWEGQSYHDALRFLTTYQYYQVIACGDIHQPFFLADESKSKNEIPRCIFNPGPMARRKVDELNTPQLYRLELNTNLWDINEIPHGKLEEVIDLSHKDTKDALVDLLSNDRPNSDQQPDTVKFKDVLTEVIEENKEAATPGVLDILASTTGYKTLSGGTQRVKAT